MSLLLSMSGVVQYTIEWREESKLAFESLGRRDEAPTTKTMNCRVWLH